MIVNKCECVPRSVHLKPIFSPRKYAIGTPDPNGQKHELTSHFDLQGLQGYDIPDI